MKVLKLTLPHHGYFEAKLPYPAKVKSAREQRGLIVVYAECNNDDPKQIVCFYVAMTGEEIKANNMHFIDTVFLNDGDLVMHVYEDRNV